MRPYEWIPQGRREPTPDLSPDLHMYVIAHTHGPLIIFKNKTKKVHLIFKILYFSKNYESIFL